MKLLSFGLKRWKLTATAIVCGLAGVAAVAWALTFTISSIFNFPPSGGSLSSYLVGYFDTRTDDCFTPQCLERGNRKDANMFLYLTNPTPISLKAYVDIFDANETSLDCQTFTFSPNKVRRLRLTSDFSIPFPHNRIGMIKIFTENSAVTASHKIQAGLKGWLVHIFQFSGQAVSTGEIFSRESTLQEVPVTVLVRDQNADKVPDELKTIVDDCT